MRQPSKPCSFWIDLWAKPPHIGLSSDPLCRSFYHMPVTRRVSDVERSYEDVKDDESNVLHKLTFWRERCKFFAHLHRNQTTVQATTARHLGVSVQICRVAEPEAWLYGSFNLCIPVSITSQPTKRVVVRFPLPYKVGGLENADEKLRCEAATYIWHQDNCPSVPIPRLHGFGFSSGQKVGQSTMC